MADSNQTRRDDFDGIMDNDPFAELTRIMGLDPRASEPAERDEPTVSASRGYEPAPAAQSFEDDFAFDLERELTGDFADDAFAAPQASSESDQWASWSEEDVSAQPSEPAPEQVYRDDWAAPAAHVAPEAYAADDQFAQAPVQADTSAERQPDDFDLDFDDDFADLDLAASLPTGQPVEPEAYQPVEAAYAEEPAGDWNAPAQFDDALSDDALSVELDMPSPDLDAGEGDDDTLWTPEEPDFTSPIDLSADLDVPELELDVDADEVVADTQWSPEPAVTPSYAALSDEDLHAEIQRELSSVDAVDDGFDLESESGFEPVADEAGASAPADVYAAPEMDADDGFDAELERELMQADTASSADRFDIEPSRVFGSDHPEWGAATGETSSGWASDASLGAASASLEDELSALLIDQPVAAASAGPIASAAAEAWKPAVNTFGRANFAPVQASRQVETPAAVAPELVSVPEPVEPVSDYEPDEPVSFEPLSFEPAASDEATGDPEPVDDFADIFAEGLDFELEEEAQASAQAEQDEPVDDPLAEAFAAPASASAAFPDLQPEQIAVAQPVMRPAFPAAAASRPQEAPEVETVEVIETAPPVTDDLDIPDLDYGEEDAPVYDDLEAEITQAFGDLTPDPAAEESGSWSAAPTAAAMTGGAVAGFAAGTAAAKSDPAADYYTAPQAQYQPGSQYAPDPFDYETDLEQAIGMAAYEEVEEPAPKNRRGLLLAGVAAGVLAVVGLGFFGMSLFGGGSDGPVLVRADGDPMKVRPENPGGATVPNQDSQAYETVAGGVTARTPEQQNLITTAEEPVDVTAQGVTDGTVLPPDATGASGELDEVLADATKSEDRIAPDAAAAEGGAPEEVAAVAPRRVRTMVVRPDGTMVPREEPVAAAPAQEQNTALAPVGGVTPAPLPSLGQTPGLETQPSAQAAAEDDGPVVNTPDTVSVFPTPRVDPQAQAAAPAPVVQQPAAPQAPAATPASVPAAAAPVTAATSEWSMQIASQPSAEGAQQAYQDLARRYGNVLEGRGVNIVRADIQGMGTYYRVRIPASNRDEAIQLCTRYKAAGGSCFVSR